VNEPFYKEGYCRHAFFICLFVCSDRKNEAKKLDAGVQTDVHPVLAHIDGNYVWSEWEMKRRAVKLTKLTQNLTKSQQTHVSSFVTNKAV